MYNFTPMDDTQLQTAALIDAGIYDFEIRKAVRKVSKSGNDMAELHLLVWDKSGKDHMIFDYLVFANQPLNIKKIKHFCDTTGLSKEYENGSIPEELEHLCGQVAVDIQAQKPKPEGGFYAAKNVVVDYVVGNPAINKPPTDTAKMFDDVPF